MVMASFFFIDSVCCLFFLNDAVTRKVPIQAPAAASRATSAQMVCRSRGRMRQIGMPSPDHWPVGTPRRGVPVHSEAQDGTSVAIAPRPCVPSPDAALGDGDSAARCPYQIGLLKIIS